MLTDERIEEIFLTLGKEVFEISGDIDYDELYPNKRDRQLNVNVAREIEREATKPCTPTLTYCARCDNDVLKCDGAFATKPKEPVAEVHPNHLRPADDNGHWCREILLYSGNNPGDYIQKENPRVKLFTTPQPCPECQSRAKPMPKANPVGKTNFAFFGLIETDEEFAARGKPCVEVVE